MEIHAITLMPELVRAVAGCGVTGRAVDAGLLRLETWNPRDYAHDAHRTVDDRAYGGGPGMVLMAGPLGAAVDAARARAPAARVIYLSPQGRPLRQSMLRAGSEAASLVLVCGRYEGVDERFIESHVDEEWSLGDYVLSGGELAAMVVIDGLARLLPGALGDARSAEQDSFSDGLLDHPHYTRPERYADVPVPPVLLSGNHGAIARWRRQQALGRTWRRRPDLLNDVQLDANDQQLLQEYQRQSGSQPGGAGENDE